MIEKVKNLRVEIDGISQLVNSLRSYNFEEFELPEQKKKFSIIKPESKSLFSDLRHVTNELSEGSGDYHKFQWICRTNKGTFRFSGNNKKDIELMTFDLKSDEVNKAYDSLMLSKAWLGKILQYLPNPSPSPYSNDGNRKTVEDIEETVDVEEHVKTKEFNSYIEKVDWLRERIKKIIEVIEDLDLGSRRSELIIAKSNSYTYLCEARFWLGFELGRYRDNDIKK